MPQISQVLETYASQFFWLLIVFGIIYVFIGHGMMPKIEATVDARDAKIADDLASAERARTAAHENEASTLARLDAARTAAREATQAAKASASRAAEARIKETDAAIEAKLAEAEAALAAARASALAEVEAVAAQAARDIVGRIAGIEVADDAATAAVRDALAA